MRNGMGMILHPAQTIYWKKKYQKGLGESNINPTGDFSVKVQ
jgi:hypothetical protein